MVGELAPLPADLVAYLLLYHLDTVEGNYPRSISGHLDAEHGHVEELCIDFSRFFDIAEQYRDRDRYLAAATVYRAIFEEVDEKYSWVEGPYDHFARTIQTAIDGYADCVLATDPSPEEFDTYAGVLEARTTTEPALNSEQFWRALDNLEEQYNE